MTIAEEYHKYPMVETYVSLARSYTYKNQMADAFQRYERALDVCYMNSADALLDDIRQQMLELEVEGDEADEIKFRKEEIRYILEIRKDMREARFDEAKAGLIKLEETGTKDPEFLLIKGNIALQENKKEDASENLFAVAQYFYDIRAIKKARFYCEQVLRIDPNRLESRTLMADIYQKQGLTSLASTEMLTLVREYLKQNKLDQAFKYVQKAVEMGNMEAHYIQGLIHFHEGKLDEAKAKFEMVNNINKQHTGALSFLARIYQRQSKFDSAMETYERLEKIQPDDPLVYFKQADMFLNRGMLKEAMTSYQKSSQLYARQGALAEAENATRMADQLWQSVHDEDRALSSKETAEEKPDHPDVKVPEADRESDMPVSGPFFESIGTHELFSMWELLSLYKKAFRADPASDELKSKLNALEGSLGNMHREEPIKTVFFVPVTALELTAFSREGKNALISTIELYIQAHPEEKPLNQKYTALLSS